jgi:heat shock protein HtpX
MAGTLAIIVGLSTLFFTVVLSLVGTFSLVNLAFFAVGFNILQWLIAPYLINAMYRVREVSESEEPKLHEMIRRLSSRLGLKMPKVMIANIPMPNAFAYGSPIAGSRVAVTTGLLKELEDEEVEAVIGHELGHVKHRDVQVMMFASVLPAIFYFLGYSLMLSSWYGGGQRRENESGLAAVIGLVSMVAYWILTLFVLGLSRLREYYADRTSALTVDDGARKLSEALAKIVASTGRYKRYRRDSGSVNSFKALFISDPDKAAEDAAQLAQARAYLTDQDLVQEILSREPSTLDKVLEVFSTHPNIVKRLRALESL